jgi:uncharacterized protein (DUF305 family)
MRTKIIFLCMLGWVMIGLGCASKVSNTSANHSAMDHNGMDHSKMDHGAASAPYDLQFLDTMVAHHQGAVDMAGPCTSRAQHAEIKTLCADIISSQQKEIADMKAWRDKWFPGSGPAVNMEMPGMADSMRGMDMKKLGTLSGNDFDLEFIKQMTPHHEGAITMAREALQKSTKADIKMLAGAIIKAQEAEITQMKGWQETWSKK